MSRNNTNTALNKADTADVDNTTTMLDQLAEEASSHLKKRYEEQKQQGIVNPIVFAQLLSIGAGKEVKPQMIYNYLRKGKFANGADTGTDTDNTDTDGGTPGTPSISTNSTQKKVISLEAANAFAQSYVSNKVAREAARQAKIEAELQGVGV